MTFVPYPSNRVIPRDNDPIPRTCSFDQAEVFSESILLASGKPLTGLIQMAQVHSLASMYFPPGVHAHKPPSGEVARVMMPFLLDCLCHDDTMTDVTN